MSSLTTGEETAMAEAWLSTGEKRTEFFSSDQIEASARRTQFVQRTSKITGKLFLALITLGRWSAAKTTVPQLAAKAAQLDVPVDITPEALQQRMAARNTCNTSQARPVADCPSRARSSDGSRICHTAVVTATG
jgi:hypothetical protein